MSVTQNAVCNCEIKSIGYLLTYLTSTKQPDVETINTSQTRADEAHMMHSKGFQSVKVQRF